MSDSSIDSRFREENPELAKEQDKLPKVHDQHGAGATVNSTPVDLYKLPPDEAAKVRAAKATIEATKPKKEVKPSVPKQLKPQKKKFWSV